MIAEQGNLSSKGVQQQGPQIRREQRAMAPEVKSFRGRQEGEDLRIKIEKAVSIIPRKRVDTNRTAGLGGCGVDFER